MGTVGSRINELGRIGRDPANLRVPEDRFEPAGIDGLAHVGKLHSRIVDVESTRVPGDLRVRPIAWHDSERGCSARLGDLTRFAGQGA